MMSRMAPWALATAGTVLAIHVTASPAILPAESARTVYISAVDSTGAPVTDLTAADVTVKEGGKDRVVASLQPATAPIHAAILVDDAGTGAYQAGVSQILQALFGHGQFSISLLNPQAAQIVDYTDDPAALKSAIGRLGMRGRIQTDGDQLLDAIASAAKELQRRKAERPVILALTVTGDGQQSLNPELVISQLLSSRAILEVVFATNAGTGQVLGDGPKLSGGLSEAVGAASAIPSVLKKITDALLNQYALTYTQPDAPKPVDRLSISTRRKGVTLIAPTRVAAQ